MYKKTITYTDFNGVERTEDFYFNMTRAEIIELELGTEGGLEQTIKKIVDSQDLVSLSKYFKDIISMSYGEKSADGKRFIKRDENGTPLFKAFSETEAYSNLYMELVTDASVAAAFINGIVPEEIAMAANERRMNDVVENGNKEEKVAEPPKDDGGDASLLG